MATKSILKNINIKGRNQTLRLVKALEQAEKHHGEPVEMSRTVDTVKKDDILDFFNKVKK